MRRLLRPLTGALLALLGALPALAASFGHAEVRIQSRSQTHRIRAELAVTQEQREQGLMGRKTLAPNAGMLFVFEEDRVATMWMHDTRIPLDMLFLAADGRIESIAARVAPMSDNVVCSRGPVRGVLELAAGAAERLGIAPGDRVTAPVLSGESTGSQGSHLRKP